jgi:hypothetical protein
MMAMINYRIKAPDGKELIIPGPEGATQAEIQAEASRQYTPDPKVMASLATSKAASEKLDKQIASGADNPNSPVAEMGGGERFIGGMGAGVRGKWLGAKQLANSVSGGLIGDEAALKAEAAEKERLDKKLTDTGMGSFGESVGKLLPDLLLGGGVGGGARRLASEAVVRAPMIPKMLASVLPKVTSTQVKRAIPAIAASSGMGAESAVTEPGKDYDASDQGTMGAIIGPVADVVARGAGRVISPRWNAGKAAVKEHLEQLTDLPMLTHAVTDSKVLKAMTNALEGIPVFGQGVKSAREKSYGQITKEITGEAGAPSKSLTQSEALAMKERLGRTADAFEAGPDVPLTEMSSNLAKTVDKYAPPVSGRASSPAIARTERAIEASSAQPSPTPTVPGIFNTINKNAAAQPGAKIFNTIEQAGADLSPGRGVVAPSVAPGSPPNVPTLTAKQVMHERSLASEIAGDPATKAEEREAARNIRDQLDKALENTLPDEGKEAYRLWKKQYGASQKVVGAGLTKEGFVPAEKYVQQLKPSQQIAPETTLQKRAVAMANLLPSPSLAENRSLMVKFLMGASIPGAGAAVGGLTGDPGNSATGALGAMTLASMLLGKGGAKYMTGKHDSKVGKAIQSEGVRESLRRLARTLGGEAVAGP